MPIEHVIVLMLENRSFDHLFAYSGIPGLHGVDTSKSNPGPAGSTVPMSSAAPDVITTDPTHEFEDVDWQMYRAPRSAAPRSITLNGFVDRSGPTAMLCAAPTRLPVLTTLAQHFLVCDNWFSSMPGPTWPNRFYVHAGSSGGLANSPSNITTIGSMIWSKLGFSFEHGTLYDALKRVGKTWRVYHGDHFPQVCAIDTMPAIFVADPNQFRSFKKLPGDMGRGDVASYTFIEPDYDILSTFRNGNSQHPSGALSIGEQLIKDVYDALTTSPIWDSSLLFIVYDEHGGFYDQVPPPQSTLPGDQPLNINKAKNPPSPPFMFDRYGPRVPAVVVSPWLQPGSVSHELYDHTSIIRTVYELFGMPGQLTNRDRAAKSVVPQIQSAPQLGAPPSMPSVYSPALRPTGSAMQDLQRHTASIDGFTRIAAQIDHALKNFMPNMPASDLQEAVRTTAIIAEVTELPVSPDPEESLAYLQKVAARIDAHRVAQGQGAVKGAGDAVTGA